MQLLSEPKMSTAMEVSIERYFPVLGPVLGHRVIFFLSRDLGVVIIDQVQIEDIKINRHHKFLVWIFNWLADIFMSYDGKYKTIKHQDHSSSPSSPGFKILR